jgi:hypothetical protein
MTEDDLLQVIERVVKEDRQSLDLDFNQLKQPAAGKLSSSPASSPSTLETTSLGY